MPAAYDAFSSSSAGTGNLSWTHTPVGTPRGVVVFIHMASFSGGAPDYDPPTYGGVAMTEITGSPLVKTATESMQMHAFFLGGSIPTGAQTVAATRAIAGTGGSSIGSAVTLTAGGDSELIDSDVSISADSQADPSAVLALGGRTCFALIGFMTGQNDPSGVTPLSSWTSRLEHDFGGQVAGVYTYDTVGTSDVTAGWTQTAEDAVAIALAISEVGGGGGGATAPRLWRLGLMGVH